MEYNAYSPSPWATHDPRRQNSQTFLYPKQPRPSVKRSTKRPSDVKVKIKPLTRKNLEGIREPRRTSYAKCYLVGLLIFLILGGIGAGVAVWLMNRDTSSSSTPGDCVVVTFTSSITFSFMQFGSVYSDASNDEYQKLASQFCSNLTAGLEKEINLNECAKQKTDPCTVTGLKSGSVIVQYEIKRTVEADSKKSDAAMQKELETAVEKVVEEGRKSSFSDNNIFKQRTTQGEVSVGETVEMKQCLPLKIPDNSKSLSSTANTNLVGTTVSWACQDGYKLAEGETVTSSKCQDTGYWSFYPTKACVDMDECNSNPCQNSGTCMNGEDGYNCTCLYGFTGIHCETKFDDCNPSACQNGATCNDLEDDYTCTCPLGFAGIHCETNMNECASDPCQNGGTCDDGINGYMCHCLEGIIGTHCETDIDECESNPCHHNATCVDGVNGYVCECLPGYSGSNCETDIDECASDPCSNDGTCIDMVNEYSCDCVSGYNPATDCNTEIKECLSSPCQNGGSCTDVFDSFECACVTGFAGPECSTVCTALPSEVLCLPFDLPSNNGFQSSTWTWVDAQNGAATQSSCGVKDKCAIFDGSDDYLKIPFFQNNYHNYGEFSTSFWFKRDSSASGEMGLFTNGECNSAEESIFVTSTGPDKIAAGIVTENDDVSTTYTNIRANDDEWHHVALVYDGSNVLFYLNNVKIDSNPTATGYIEESTCEVYIAKKAGSTNFKGEIDELCIYTAALTEAMVTSLFYQPTQCDTSS